MKNMKTNMCDKLVSLALMAGSVILLLTVSSFSGGVDRKPDYTTPELVMISVQDTIPDKRSVSKEEIEKEIEDAINEAKSKIEDIDWGEIEKDIKEDMESVRTEIDSIDWEEIRAELEQSMANMKMEIENSMIEINWDEIEKEMGKVIRHLDSLKNELESTLR